MEKEEKEKGNGYYGRKLISKFGKLDLDTSDKKWEIQAILIRRKIQKTLKKLALPYIKNAKRNMGKNDYKGFKEGLKKIM